MKVVILAGGMGTRISDESDLRPKPMVEIGGKPILWHIMKHYAAHGHNQFVILCGYRGYTIKEYFANYFLHNSDITVSTRDGKMEVHRTQGEDWQVTLVDTGLNTMTGSRLKRAKYLLEKEDFFLTYGDGVGDVNIDELKKFHASHGKIMTVTSVQPEGRFGALDVGAGNRVERFLEKPKGDGAWINGGFFVCKPKLFDYIGEGEDVVFEREPMETLAEKGELFAYKHTGFWKPMDTPRDKKYLNELWDEGSPKWKTWKD